jgi:hypothetical protein
MIHATRSSWALLLLILMSATAHGADPVLTRIFPRGGQRGTELTLRFQGQRLGDAQQILIYDDGFTVKEIKSVNANRCDAVVTIADDCALGEHRMRVRTATGLSDLYTFWVGQFPTVDEAEPNSDFDAPQAIVFGSTVDGKITNEDVDYYIVEAKAGQRISAEIEAMRLGLDLFDPYIAIMNMKRFELAACDDTALLLQDSIATIVAPEDGTYVVMVRDASYGGDGNSLYRLHVGAFPRPRIALPAGGKPGEATEVTLIGDEVGDMVMAYTPSADAHGKVGLFAEADGLLSPSPVPFRVGAYTNVMEVEPNNGIKQATATDAALPLAFNGVIGEADDWDSFRFVGKKDQRFMFRAHARSIGSPLDPVMSIHDAEGKRLGGNDDTGGLDSAIDFTLPADGEYVLRITDHLRAGGPTYVYRIETETIEPSLAVYLPNHGRYGQKRQIIAVPRGNRYAWLINVARENFRGDILLDAPGLPAGVTMHARPIPASQNSFAVMFEADAGAALDGKLIELVARHAENEKIQGGYFHTVPLVRGLPNETEYYATTADRAAVAVIEQVPFELELVQPKVPLVQSGSMQLRVVAKRAEGFDAPIAVRMLWTSPGVGATTTVTIPKGQTEVAYPINAAGNAAVGTWPMIVLGESDAGDGEIFASSKYIDLEVAPPYVAMTIDMAAIERGKEGQLVCRVTHNKPFEGEAQVTLHGLPAHVSTEPRTLSAGVEELVFPITTAAEARAGKNQRLFCQVVITAGGEPIVHSVGQWGVLRIDDPPPPPPAPPQAAAAKPEEPKPAPPPATPQERRLTRLEQLRLDAERRREGGQ